MINVVHAKSDVLCVVVDRIVPVAEREEFVPDSTGSESSWGRDVLAPGEIDGCLVRIGDIVFVDGVTQLAREGYDVFGAGHLVRKVGLEVVDARSEAAESVASFLVCLVWRGVRITETAVDSGDGGCASRLLWGFVLLERAFVKDRHDRNGVTLADLHVKGGSVQA